MAVEKKRINIYLPAELYTKLRQIVDCCGSSVNGYLVWLIGNEVYDFEQFSEQENSLDDAKLVRRSFTDISEKRPATLSTMSGFHLEETNATLNGNGGAQTAMLI